MDESTRNLAIREAAVAAVQRLIREEDDSIPWSAISAGFSFLGVRINLSTKAEGIFKPRELTDGAALSIRTVNPARKGRSAPYEDHAVGDGVFLYKLQRGSIDNHRNRLLFGAWEQKKPLIYFYGVADAVYSAIYPTYIDHIDQQSQTAIISVQSPLVGDDKLLSEPEKEYANRMTKIRIHQAQFRAMVLGAYRHSCAITHLALPRLLNAAHIIPDTDPRSRPIVANGLCLSNFHHAAYDGNLIGIDPDLRVHVKRRILKASDGPLLQHGLKDIHGIRLRVPSRIDFKPNRDFLAERFAEFSSRNS